MSGLCLVTKGFICHGRQDETICPPQFIGSGGVIREEIEKPRPTIRVINTILEHEEEVTKFDHRMKNVKIEISNVSIKLGE